MTPEHKTSVQITKKARALLREIVVKTRREKHADYLPYKITVSQGSVLESLIVEKAIEMGICVYDDTEQKE